MTPFLRRPKPHSIAGPAATSAGHPTGQRGSAGVSPQAQAAAEESEAERKPDPAASMSLLTNVLANPLDAGYTQYGRQKQPSTTLQKVVVLLTSVALGLAASAAVKNLRSPSRVDVVDTLTEQVRSRSETVSTIDAEVLELRQKITAAGGSEVSEAQRADLPTQIATASTPLTGQGLTVTLKEGAPVGVDADRRALGKVRDHDLRIIVNALWSADAEAISVNGIRIGPGSFIRTAGQSVIVNITPVQPPYVINAIGDPQELSIALIQGETGDYLSSIQSIHGIVMTPQTSSSVSVPAVEQRAIRFATTQEVQP